MTTNFKNLPDLAPGSADGLDITAASIESDGERLSLVLELTGSPQRHDEATSGIGSPSAFDFEFWQGDRVVYSGYVSLSSSEPPELHVLDRELWDDMTASGETYRGAECPGAGESVPTCGGSRALFIDDAFLSDAGRVEVGASDVTITLDLDRFPRLLWGMSWSVMTRGHLARGKDLIPHVDRAPVEGTASFPARTGRTGSL